MLSEQKICKIVCPETQCTGGEQCSDYARFVRVCAAQEEQTHKADQEDFQKQKQEVIETLNELDNWIDYIHGKFQETGTGNAYQVRISNLIKKLSTNGE